MARHPDPPPLRTRDTRTVGFGTAVWAVLLTVALLAHHRLAREGHDWYLASAAVATGLGLVGVAYCARRESRSSAAGSSRSSRSSSASSSVDG